MTDKEEIRYLMEQEQAAGALRDCIEMYRQGVMPDAMKLRGVYLAYLSVGFNEYEAFMIMMRHVR